MKKTITSILLLVLAVAIPAQVPGLNTAGPGNTAGILYASNFGLWSVPQGNVGNFSWSSPNSCKVSPAGLNLTPAFAVGTPITIVDANPAHTEIVNVTGVTSSGAGCSITTAPTSYAHNSFYLASSTCGLQESINWAAGLPYMVIASPDWQRMGCTTSTITSAKGNYNVSILDARSSILVEYTWNGTAYVANTVSSGVTEIIPGTNITCSPEAAGSCVGNVTVNSSAGGGGLVPANANFVTVGASLAFDDTHVLAAAIPVSGWTTTGGTTTVTNTGTNHLVAGEWVDMWGAGSWPVNGTYESGTGQRIFQVLSTGLSATQFEINTSGITAGSCASSCGNAHSANAYIPYATSTVLGMPSAAYANTYAWCAVDGTAPNCTLYALSLHISAILTPLEPGTTGKPLYVIVNSPINDLANCYSPATIEGYYQTIFEGIHAAGGLVVAASPTGTNTSTVSNGPCAYYKNKDTVNQWLRLQGAPTVLASTPTSTAYWDIFSDWAEVMANANDTNVVASNGGAGLTGAQNVALTTAADLESGGGRPLSQLQESAYFGIGGNLSSSPASVRGWLQAPTVDSSAAFRWTNAAQTADVFAVDTSSGGVQVGYGYGSSAYEYIGGHCSNGSMLCVLGSGGGTNYALSIGAYGDAQFGFSGGGGTLTAYETAIKLIALAAGSGENCLQIDSSGNVTNTGSACASGASIDTLTMNASNSGGSSPQTFNGSANVTISANTLGAASLANPNIYTGSGAASTSVAYYNGTPYTGGSTTTNYPFWFMNFGTTPTNFNTLGEIWGINCPSGYTGYAMHLWSNGTNGIEITCGGNVTAKAITATSLLATGIVDGTAPVTVTTGSSATLGGTYKSGYTFNQEATAGTAVTYTLPTAAAGLQYCVANSYNGSAANTGTLELLTSASGQFIIFTDGTLSATGGYVISAGAARDSACVVGVDSTHWMLYVSSGTWAKH